MDKITELPIVATQSVDDDLFDSYIYIGRNLETDLGASQSFANVLNHLKSLKKHNSSFESEITFTVFNDQRVIYSPTGPLDRDYDDVRRITDASSKAVSRAIKSGSKRPLLINTVKNAFSNSASVSLLGALEASYIPLEIREANNETDKLLKVEKLGFWHENLEEARSLINLVNGIELGRIAYRDIGGSDPERMAAANVLAYVNQILGSTEIKVSVVEGQETFEKEYPLFAAVNRAANFVPRHRGRIIKLEYTPPSGAPVDKTIFLVGKGITYDTGGADVKAGGHMSGMHRDKCGAAFVAGFFKTLSLLNPRGLKVFGTLCLARNSIGEECYVADEIITARSKKRIRVGNTDAEGRMVMGDLLCEAKEMALNEVNPDIFTIATLTGHVIRAYGPSYTAIMCNGPARADKIDQKFFQSGEVIGDPFEISTIRREDFNFIAGKSEYEDILQASNNPSTMDSRGHQYPSAFLICASGLDKHGNDSEKKLAYSHVDIAGSSGPFPGIPTGSPIPAFVYNYVLPRL